jgi:hypothetical protein
MSAPVEGSTPLGDKGTTTRADAGRDLEEPLYSRFGDNQLARPTRHRCAGPLTSRCSLRVSGAT